ncbi:hypothetical protein QFX18_18850 [Saccharophagus degradans]|uniref:hypothetical protein n=1 Tax=Saccharophagus degradans TaxID=86304 RepID=UPI002477FC07|nr:hypothetical protein [Saccharophagus degradans]WGO98068.1 hypothetical protein QFX18_18850 [Saccharophagus degradans]
MASSETRKQQIIVICAAILVVLASVITTVIVSGVGMGGSDKGGYQNVTFTDAVHTCKKNLRSTYANQLESLVVDDHSSRYDDAEFVYKIFFDMDLKKKGEPQRSVNYVNCFVHAASGRVSKLEVFEEVETRDPSIPGNETNAFGWPK